jgi:molecular chaperone DnaJ
MSSKRDYYEILGLKKADNPSEADIKTAYRKLALKYHPDSAKRKNIDLKKAEEKFKEINEAYSILSDPEKKAAYDRFGHAAFQPGGFGTGQGPFGTYSTNVDPFQIFSEFFGGMDLNEIFGGSTQKGRRRAGSQNPFSSAPFTVNFGSSDPFGSNDRFHQPEETKLPKKGDDITLTVELESDLAEIGTTKTITMKKGAQKEEIKIKIPANIKDGQKLRIPERGKAGTQGGEPGDLFIKIQIIPAKPTKQIQRIPFIDAILGNKISVTTLAGKVEVIVPPGTQTGSKMTLSEMGELIGESNKRKDLELEFKVIMPHKDALTEKQREKIEELRKYFSTES